ncbi:GNAT family N-acetyltransferase [Clostridium sp. MCC353]|uniref:GNAT family N-acetyltransferase n=1 Tax=Clostridium sp. MCC353 TaxID=2592646 RepID=UPI001C01210E|nr:GNAT family N-acetyltransferase [Clostridium sp. MCC353]MBT9779145.1 GNAT family N-acetyltransferase [Clostridium sp. MCC353]
MKTKQTWTLSEEEKIQIRSVVTSCCGHDSTRLSYPLEEGARHFLLFDDDGSLISALSLFFSWEDCCECTAFTLPEKRGQGCFSQLFDLALSWLEEKEEKEDAGYDLLFVTSPGCRETMNVLNAIGAEYDYSEYMMERAIKKETEPEDPIHLEFQEDGLCLGLLNHQLIGSCRLDYGCGSACLYEMEIKEPFRNQGLGTRFLWSLFPRLMENGILILRLQVTSANKAALSLYKKTGFHICETLSYYLY